jgi:hypothetical protein
MQSRDNIGLHDSNRGENMTTPETLLGAIISIGLGIALVFMGKNLRLFAAAAGFLLGVQFINLFNGGLLLGLITGAILAVIFIVLLGVGKAMIALVIQLIGAAAGASILAWLLRSLGLDFGILGGIIVAAVGAVLGFILMARFYDWGLVILVGLVGASLIVSGVNYFIPLGNGVTTVATLALAGVGAFVQQRK